MKRNWSALWVNFGEWVYRLLILNVLWWSFSLLGVGIVGIFPASTACLALIRDGIRGKWGQDIPKRYWAYFRRDFWVANALGYFVTVLFLLTVIDWYYFFQGRMVFSQLFAFFFLFMAVYVLVAGQLLFAYFSHFQDSLLNYLFKFWILPLRFMRASLALMGMTLFYGGVMWKIPGLFVFIGMPLFLMAGLVISLRLMGFCFNSENYLYQD